MTHPAGFQSAPWKFSTDECEGFFTSEAYPPEGMLPVLDDYYEKLLAAFGRKADAAEADPSLCANPANSQSTKRDSIGSSESR